MPLGQLEACLAVLLVVSYIGMTWPGWKRVASTLNNAMTPSKQSSSLTINAIVSNLLLEYWGSPAGSLSSFLMPRESIVRRMIRR